MDIPRLKKLIAPGPLSRDIIYAEHMPSTQIYAKDMSAGRGISAHGTIILADRQSSGYGRHGRTWQSPPGGLWFSLVLPPRQNTWQLIKVFSVSLAESLERASGRDAFIKWPNDIIINNKKIAGCIMETSMHAHTVQAVIFGAGININNPIPDDLRHTAVALAEITDTQHDLENILSDIVTTIQASYTSCTAARFDTAYTQRSILLNKRITAVHEHTTYTGTAKSIDEEGRLKLIMDNGDSIALTAADSISF